MPVLRCEKCKKEATWRGGFYVLSYTKHFKSGGEHNMTTDEEIDTLCKDCMGQFRIWLTEAPQKV